MVQLEPLRRFLIDHPEATPHKPLVVQRPPLRIASTADTLTRRSPCDTTAKH